MFVLKRRDLLSGHLTTEVAKRANGGESILRPKVQRKRYTLAELIAQYDLNAPMPTDMVEFENAPLVGIEVI